ncbi:DUF4082 domain-containing protein [Gramella sp. MT6]|uniref:Ig-like domain-containing protein n=1 Tax=Gramella sp. MT6 TaxID=2705471 RepID=UPI001C5F8C3D|nr:Ig-like domain-containing protein [Gramella sp. MT6]QYA25198.1 DUF4082 domain-containing protein [Gramella sp. MT6]
MLFKFLVLLFFPISFSASTININVEGPGGPILVLTSATNPFSSYTSEILLAEGFNEYATSDVSLISGEVLSNYDVIIVGEIPLSTTQVSLLGNWVEAGGTLIVFKPDSNLAPLLGIQKLSGTLADSYLLINTATGPGNGLVDETIQFHSEAGLYDLNGATSLATLYSSATTSTSYPAVTTYSVGENGGVAVAFAYDLSRSVVYTRQGNPTWNAQERDGARPIRSNDLFYPDWVNLSKVEIPQADEQQRLLANIIVQNSNKPMPRFWYLPRGLKAAVVMTGDDHASGGTIARFNQYLQLSTDNSPEAVADWRTIRGSSYIYPNTPITEQQAKNFEDQGFEIALHLNTNCNNYTAQSIEGNLVTQLSQFRSFFPSLAEPETNRTHCIAFSDWASQPIAETNNGIRLDANYYYWPEFWVQDRPGLFTGSGFAMRFADLDGTIIDTYQLATQMTDESGQNYPFTIDRLLDNALGSKGYYGVFCANMHTDETYSPGSDAIIASASSRNVPVISAKQLLTWLDGRNGSFFENLIWDGSALSFNMGIGNGALNLEAMLPLVSGTKRMVGLNLDNVPVNYRTERIKGIDYAIFQAQSGNFIATYEINEPPVVSIDSPVNNATFLAFEDIEISAQASDPDGNVVKVEFFEGNTKIGEDIDSSNGWSFSWLQVEDGTYSITAKATDDKGSITFSEVVSITVEIDPSNFNCPCTVFENLVFPNSLLNEGAGIQLGMKFSSEIDGYINGVRFYKQNGHTGTHIGQLYDSSGNLLAEATFTNESNSGWQEVLFSNSVQITQNTTYIVSYHSSEGYYSVSDSYFVQAEENRPLKALANGENGPNGVYILSNTPAFPTDSFEASNYWVDAIFNTEPMSLNIPPVVNITNPTQGANFTEPADIEITALASDDDGQVVKVEFFNGTTKLGEDLDPLEDWSYSWSDVPSGNYTIRAVATDDQGRTAESSISISVTTIPVSQNSIVVENSLPGNPPSEWDIDGAGDLSIQGFATDISYNIGETARFKIDTDANNYSVKIYRLGYYQGNGARYQGDATITANLPQNQPNCISDSQTGLLDCGNWGESAIWDIPATATSGIYIAKLTRGNGGSSHILFVVRDDSSNSDLFFQTSDATWQAYNIYGGRSLYTGSGGKATKVSYNRPFLTRDGGGGGGAEEDWIFNAEYPMLRWLERNGFDVTYTTNVDSDRRGELIKNHRVFLSVGHDEYWSGPHRNYVESARDQGTSLAFFSGNEVYWKTRWENSIDGNGNSHRTLVCYKEGSGGENTCGGKCDPTNDWTGLWRDGCNYVTGDPDLDGCRPENTLTGQISWEESDASITVPSSFKDLRFWRNTSVAELNEGQNASFTYATIGYEWNSEQDSYSSFYPDGRILMSRTVVDGAVHNISLYKHNSGAFVFGAGTVQWSWGLDSNHDRGDDAPSPDMQQATINLLADMGAQPASIQPGMIRATPSTDIEAPLLTYTSPAEETVVPVNTELLITGSTEEQNVIVAVEVSTDGGITWENAEGKQDWSYAWTPSVTGPASIQVRSYDDSGNLSAPEILNLTVSDELNNLVPEVEITGPLNNSQFISPAEIDITATASDSDGTITKVEFFSNNIKIGEDLISPYSFNWSNVGTGNYVLTARAIDNTGAFAISTEIAVSVILDSNNPNCPCTVFSNSDAPSSGIKNDGNAIQLGMKFRTTVDGIVTGVRFYKQNGDPGTHIGQLFDPSGTILAQTVFENETGSGWQQANFSNPVEVVAGNTYIISYHSSDGYYSSDDRGLENEISNGPVIGIANGENGPNGVYRYSPNPTFPNLSYQASNYWVDVVFETIGNPNSLPTVSISSPIENDSFIAPADILITAEASDSDGTVTSVEFFQGTVSVGLDNDNSDGWSFNWLGALPGNYELSAIATDDLNGTTVSEIVNITVAEPLNTPPTAVITAPLNNEIFTSPADIILAADATDADGSVTSVEFFEGSNSLGTDSDGSDGWSVTWNGVTAGSYALTAVATDNGLETTTSEIINITVESPNVLPTVAITSPLNNETFTAPADIIITADATDADGSVSSVEFFEGSNSLGTDLDGSDGWSVNWNGVTAGSYALTAVATDDALETTTSEIINITVEDPNQLPTVAITSPLNNEIFTSQADIIITADATDADGSVTSVEFFEGSNSLGTDSDGSDGWSVTWNGVTAGSYALTAVATDNALGTSTSEIINISVESPNVLPTVAITAPLNNEIFTSPADVIITADATDADGNLTSVEFFEGSNSLGTDLDGSDGWSVNWNGVTAGSYALTAVATDNDLETTTSEIINITVEDPNQLPTVAISSPLNNEIFTSQADIIITVDATDADGSVTSVEFFEGSNSLGTDLDGSDGWSVNWNGVTAGSYALTAVATDNDLETTTSEIINITVEDPNQLPTVAISSPLNNEIFTSQADIIITVDATDADGSVTSVEFFEGSNSLGTDSDGSDGWSVTWIGVSSGSYALTAVATDNALESTTSEIINISVESPNVLPTVAITAPLNNEIFTAPADIIITAAATDADGTVTSVEFFEGSNSLGTDSDGSDGWSLTWNGVTAGSYALSVVATDNDLETTTSEIINITVEDPNQLPNVAISSPLNNEIFTAPADIILTAAATDADGSVTSVEFFEGSNSLGTDSDGSDGWSVTWNGVTAGSYALTAVATDNALGTSTSEIINISVESPNVLPTVAITAPLNNEIFTSPADVIITADATDADGNLTSVEFFEGSNSLGTDLDGSDGWSVNWNGVTAGSYALTAVATDNDLETTTSEIINISVESPNVLPTVVITARR